MIRAPKQTYHVVTSADGTILAVYGAALKAEAVQHAAKMTATTSVHRVSFYVDTVTRTRRPAVGGRL